MIEQLECVGSNYEQRHDSHAKQYEETEGEQKVAFPGRRADLAFWKSTVLGKVSSCYIVTSALTIHYYRTLTQSRLSLTKRIHYFLTKLFSLPL